MKRPLIILMLLFTYFNVHAQDITGQWNGVLEVQGTQLRLILNISKTIVGFISTLDSPDQGVKDIRVDTIIFKSSVIKFTVEKLQITFTGTVDNDGKNIAGILTQADSSLPLDLSRMEIEKKLTVRPQDPVKPYPYHSEDLKFMNEKAGIELAGTLTLPDKIGVYPVVVLISGGGPQNRNEESMGHKPFLVLSDHLTRNGIGVFRYDDRGVADSKGDFMTATSLDFALDAEAAVEYLKSRKEIDKSKIGLMGHSEGGYIVPMIAARNNDISYIVLLAGPGVTGEELIIMQSELMQRVSGKSEEVIKVSNKMYKGVFDIVKSSDDQDSLKTEISGYIKKLFEEYPEIVNPEGNPVEEMIAMRVEVFSSPWFKFFLEYDPAQDLEKVKCPVLAVNGEKDLQVPSKINLKAINNALKKGGNKNVTTKEFAGLNHGFQESKTGLPEEYSSIEQTFSPEAMEFITEWIIEKVK